MSRENVSTLNDDDLYEPEYLEVMLAAMEANPSYSMAFSDHFIVDKKGQCWRRKVRRIANDLDARCWSMVRCRIR